MSTTRVAKLFKSGASQAVRLPVDFRFEGDEVYVTRDDRTGDVLLSGCSRAAAWAAFYELQNGTEIPEDFMRDRPMNGPPPERDLFGNEP